MARIRSLKPDFFRSVTIAKLSFGARLTFQGLWCHADDDGRYRYEPALVKADVWPLDDDITAGQVATWMGELEALGRVCCYTVEGRGFLHIVNWEEHQRIDHKGNSKIPPCPKDTHGAPLPPRGLDEGSTNTRNGFVEPSELDIGSGSRRGSKERDLKTIVEQARPITIHPTLVEQGFDLWREVTGKHKAKLDPKRRRKLEQAFQRYPPEDVFDAIRGWKNSPYHCGQNDRGTVYNELDLLLRDAAHIEQFRDLARDGPGMPMGKRMRQMVSTDQALAQWAAAEGVNGNGQAAVGTDRRPPQRELARPAD